MARGTGGRSSRWAAALVLALVASSSSLLSARGQTPITGPIKHVVLLMQENRSFDHMLGWLKVENPEVDGVNGTEWNPRDPNDPNDPEKYAFFVIQKAVLTLCTRLIRFYVTNNAIYITGNVPSNWWASNWWFWHSLKLRLPPSSRSRPRPRQQRHEASGVRHDRDLPQ